MNEIRRLRRQRGMTQTELANVAGTSQPTVAAYESGRKSPTLKTLRRISEAAGLEAHVQFHPPLTREDRRSLALHGAIAEKLASHPDAVLEQARRNLRRTTAIVGTSAPAVREWNVILHRPLEALLPVLADPSPWARELRHVTPFAGVLTAAERAQVLRAFAEEEQTVS